MKSNFTVKCHYCRMVNDFTGDNWHDELLDDTTGHTIPCMFCGKDLYIVVDAVYTLSLELSEDEECDDEYIEDLINHAECL